MEAIVLAGGFGKRLKSVIKNQPKPMAPINGIPFLEILLTNLAKNGFKKIVLSLHYEAQVIVNYFGDKFSNLEIVYAVEDLPLGTGGAIINSLRYINNDHLYVLNGDTFMDLNFFDIEKMWKKYNSNMIVLKEINNTSRYGSVEIEGKFIKEFTEKKSVGKGLINAGIYLLRRDLFNINNRKRIFSFEKEFLNIEIKNKLFYHYISDGLFIDIGIPDDYRKAQILLR